MGGGEAGQVRKTQLQAQKRGHGDLCTARTYHCVTSPSLSASNCKLRPSSETTLKPWRSRPAGGVAEESAATLGFLGRFTVDF